MLASLTDNLYDLATLRWLAGPIFDKELRAASRRKRTYALRSGYILMLIGIVAICSMDLTFGGPGTSAVTRVARMAEITRQVTGGVTWLQFIVAQLAVVTLLSGSFCDEIQRRTLATLMTTPITSVQMVLGKLLSRMLQVVLLAACTLALLSVLRGFGGVDWQYVFASFWITVCAVLVAGSVTMFFSVRARRAHNALLVTILVLLAGNIVSAFAAFFLTVLGLRTTGPLCAILSGPLGAMVDLTSRNLSAGAGLIPSWSLSCLSAVGLSGVILALTVARVRRAVTLEAFGGPAAKTRPRRRRSASTQPEAIRPVTGSPIFWREVHGTDARSTKRWISAVSLMALWQIVTSFAAGAGVVAYWAYTVWAVGLWLLVESRTAVMAAMSIAAEKEARTLPVVLGTPIGEARIVWDKALAVVRKNLCLWVTLVIASLVFAVFYYFRALSVTSPFNVVLAGVQTGFWLLASLASTAANLVAVVGCGLYFGVRLRSAASAVMAAVLSVVGLELLWYLLRTVLYAAAIRVFGFGFSYWSFAIMPLVVHVCLHVGIGLLLLRQAKRGLRRHIF